MGCARIRRDRMRTLLPCLAVLMLSTTAAAVPGRLDEALGSDDKTDAREEDKAEDADAAAAGGEQNKKAMTWDDDDVEDSVAFARTSRFIGIPSLILAGCLIGGGLHAMWYGDQLLAVVNDNPGVNTSTMKNAEDGGEWSHLGGTIALLSAIPFALIGEIALGMGAYGDVEVAQLFAEAGFEEAAAPAWGRLPLWEAAAHMAAVGGALAFGGGLLTIVGTVVAPRVREEATGPGADDVVSALEAGGSAGMTTLIAGIIVLAVSGGAAGGGWWLDAVVDDMADANKPGYDKKAAAKKEAAPVKRPDSTRVAMAF